MAELLDVPLLIVHVSAGEAIDVIRDAQTKGLKIYGETCPQYLFLTADDIGMDLEGTKFCCSPPPRDQAAQEAVWRGLQNGTFQVFSSDHAPYRYDETGKLLKGDKTTFKDTANGVPGIELRVPLLFSEGVGKGRLDLNRFVALTATNHARLYGLYPKKGTIAVGSDADIAIWDPAKEVTVARRRHPRQCRLHALRGHAAQGLAGDGPVARPDRRRGRQAPRRARQRQFPPLRPLRRRQAARPRHPRTRLRRRKRRAVGVTHQRQE